MFKNRSVHFGAILLFALFLFGALGATPVVAGTDVRIGFIDMQKAVSGTEEWKTKLSQFRSRFEKEKGIIAARENKIKEMLEDLNKKSFVLSPELKKQKEEEFRQEKKDFERYVQDKNEDFGKKEKEITAQIIEKMMKVVKKIGTDKGYAVILEQKIGLYFDTKHDLTELAITTYDRLSK